MKEIIFKDIWIKILSLFLAMSLWIFITYRGQSELAVDVPVEFKNLPAGLEILKQNIKNVSLNIRGNERVLKGLRPMDIRTVVDLSNAKKGEGIYYINADNIKIPGSIKVLRIEPSNLNVVIDESVSKTVAVKASISGLLEKGLKVKSVELMPSSVVVEGPKTEVEKISVLRTESIDITGIDTDIMQDVKFNLRGRNIRTKVSEVTVKIKISRD